MATTCKDRLKFCISFLSATSSSDSSSSVKRSSKRLKSFSIIGSSCSATPSFSDTPAFQNKKKRKCLDSELERKIREKKNFLLTHYAEKFHPPWGEVGQNHLNKFQEAFQHNYCKGTVKSINFRQAAYTMFINFPANNAVV